MGAGMPYKSKDAERSYQKQYRKSTRSRKLKHLYGITEVEWTALFEKQGRRCAVCGSVDPGNKKGIWHTDHCHITGEVRGILCLPCNTMLGSAKDDILRLLRAVSYLDDFWRRRYDERGGTYPFHITRGS